MSDYITTYTKKHFTPLSPVAEDIDIRDIAHALSLIVRANGHFPEFYSVAQHSIHCAEEAMARKADPRKALLCLLHDASEAYIADVTRPLKRNLSEYREAEEKLQTAIYIKLTGFAPDKRELEFVSMVDDTLLCHEFKHYIGEQLFDEELELHSSPDFEFVPFKEIENKFIELFDKLTMQLERLKKVRMIALDLDGTLLLPGSSVSERVRSVLARAAERGVEIVPASGRSFEGMPDYVKSLPGVHYLVTANGADVYTVEGKRLYERSISCADAADLAKRITDKGIIVGVYIDGRGYMEREAFETVLDKGVPYRVWEYFKNTRTLVENLSEFIAENNRDVQIITCHFYNVAEDMRNEITSMIPGYKDMIYVWGGPANIDITHFEASKGFGLNVLAEMADIKYTAAFGDSENDADMLKKATFGFAMENGDRYAWDAADFVAISNADDGVADAIERLILHGDE